MKITSRMPRAEYDTIAALNISRLKEMKRSALHFKHLLDQPKVSDPLTLGTATHVAVLEPERYASEFTVWDRTTSAQKMAPRSGQYWEQFVANAGKKTILTPEQHKLANAIAAAVRFHPAANKYLEVGDPEVTLEWNLPPELGGRAAKGRVDWLTNIEGEPYLVGLKTARDCRHFAFGAQAARLGYHMQWAYYHDGFKAIRNRVPQIIEIVVESEAPHALAVYRIGPDIIEQGRDDYLQLLATLTDCESRDTWPGPVPSEEWLTLPSWAYPQADDLNDLELETA